ncbi:MAG: aminotransferase class IV [Candidatus Gracilibacteria bacterium]
MVVFLNGKFVEAHKARVSVFDHGFLYGDGVYETLRTYEGKPWQFNLHWARFVRSAKLLGLTVPYGKSEVLHFLHELMQRNRFRDARIRFTLTRGENGFDFNTSKKPTFAIIADVFVAQPASVYAKGVGVVTMTLQRLLPEAKTISLLHQVLAKRYAFRHRAYETLLVDRGKVTEGSFTNVYIFRRGVLVTPKEDILFGTTRQTVLAVARRMVRQKAGGVVKIAEKNISLQQLYDADEIFLTSAPRGIIPVVQVDGKKIGSGKVGPLTGSLMRAYADYVRSVSL